mgnify:CR=1 FL=1
MAASLLALQVVDILQEQLEDSLRRQQCLLWVLQAVGGALALRLLWRLLRRPWVQCLILLLLISSGMSWWLLLQGRGDVLVGLNAAMEAAVEHLQVRLRQTGTLLLDSVGQYLR